MENLLISQRGQAKYSWDGYIYTMDKTNKANTIQFWRCEHKHENCKGRIWTNLVDGTFHSIRNLHTCSTVGNAANVVLQKTNTAVKHLATTTMENPSQIRGRILENVPTAIKGILPNANVMQRTVQRVRINTSQAPANPETREEINIPEEYSLYEYSPTNFENFLLADSGNGQVDPQRILIFGREYHSTWSASMKDLFVDGTFLLCPPLFAQIFVILARKDTHEDKGPVFPVLYCLLPDKSTETYVKLFRMVKELWPQLNPESISVDYELGIHQAVRQIFPEAEIWGCLFHLVKNLRRHLSSCNLLGRYNFDPEFALQAKMITSLAFVPQEDVITAIAELENYLPNDFEPILEWFSNNYIGRLRNNGTRVPATFPSAIWSVYFRTLNGRDRTNNFAEACHRKLQLAFGSGIAHPTLWTFIENLKKVQAAYDADYESAISGRNGTIKRRRYVEADERILNKVANYNGQNITEYLRGISYNYNMD